MKNVVQSRIGFTLIELLVVVLIMGILAAVALPQYQKAVVRAQTRKMILDVKAIGAAQRSYYLEHGSYPNKFSDLDVVPNGYPSKNCSNFAMFGTKTDCISNENNVLYITTGGNTGSLFNQGKYLRSGFVRRGSENNLYCYQYGSFRKGLCTQILNCIHETNMGDNSNTYFTCPSL